MFKSIMTATHLQQTKLWPQDTDDPKAVWTFFSQHLSIRSQPHTDICLRVSLCNPSGGPAGDLQNRVAGHAPKGLEGSYETLKKTLEKVMTHSLGPTAGT